MNYRKKIFKLIAKYFPYNGVRVGALRQAGYQIGRHVYIGEELHITDDLSGNSGTRLIIGDRVAIAQRVTIILASDPNWSKLVTKVECIRGTVCIKNDAWIGAGSIILPNITVGEQAIVGAGSVVTKDVLPATIVVGNPAHFLRNINT
jgi:acetyltransferase-like isoleucine patch superfamily enzyme